MKKDKKKRLGYSIAGAYNNKRQVSHQVMILRLKVLVRRRLPKSPVKSLKVILTIAAGNA